MFLVRHAQTEWNVASRLQGQLDSPLTPDGTRQAEALAARLRHRVTHIVTSPLGRCLQTAHIIAEASQLPAPSPEPRWSEQHLGRLQGKAIAELRGADFAQYLEWKQGSPDFRIEGGETRRDVLARSSEALQEMARACHVESLCVITHGGVLSVLLRALLGISLETPRRFRLDNCAFNHLRYEHGSFTVETLGDSSHLRP